MLAACAEKSVTLVLGGVRSGKSRYAQTLAEKYARVTFIATARRDANDAEMSAKIARHVAERPAGWVTVEEPFDVASAVLTAEAVSDVIVVDCLTLLAANLLQDEAAAARGMDELCGALARSRVPVILVSNEVGSGVVPAYKSGRRFRDLVGELNQRVAAVADNVVYMVAGLPMVVKGASG